MMAEKKLEVKDLRVTFKTDHGLVQAVRDISFDLYEGETLCIVGESGSGKSVTSKTIMQILANNAIIEKGSIIYEGENLLDISEDEFYKIRGHKIGMIFQDPLSSLNPIVRIGHQITEATLVNADKLKQRYDDLISKELIEYKNAIAHRNINVKKEKDKYFLVNANTKKAVEKGEMSKADAKAKLSEAKAEMKKNIATYDEELKKVLPDLKDALNKRKKEAKEDNKQFKAKIYEEHAQKIKDLNNRYSDKSLEEYKKEKEAIDLELIDKTRITKTVARQRAIEIMKEVGIPMPERRFRQYPFEFSGGMRQRIVIAIALTANPDVLICDEPTTALDVTIQAQILELINKIKKERGLSCIFITHDLGVVANMADRVAVMYAGKIVEYGKAEEIFYDPRHPYTWALLSSIPDIDSKEKLEAIPGTPPDMIYPPKGDAFAARNKYALNIDYEAEPPFFKVTDTHYAATWLLHPDAPKVEMPKIVSERIRISLAKGGKTNE